jgi:hypothetical protein
MIGQLAALETRIGNLRGGILTQCGSLDATVVHRRPAQGASR